MQYEKIKRYLPLQGFPAPEKEGKEKRNPDHSA
jgi:hypothetical protein